MKSVAHPVLRHRIVTTFQANSEGMTPDKVIDYLIAHTPIGVQERGKKAAKP